MKENKEYDGKIIRQQTSERYRFTYDERLEVGAKSDDRCCHCGRKIYPDFGAEVDHFVPISKGGTNNPINRVMLCRVCNLEKQDKIYEPEMYLKYLKPEYKVKLLDYFDSFVHSYAYFGVRSVTACDRYTYQFLRPAAHRKKGKTSKNIAFPVTIDRVGWSDMEEVNIFLKRYFEKHGIDHDPASASLFLNSFSSFYTVRRNGEITLLAAAFLTRHEVDVKDAASVSLTIIPMPLYDNVTGHNIADLISTKLPLNILYEQNIDEIPVTILSLGDDPFTFHFAEHYGYKTEVYRGSTAVFIDTKTDDRQTVQKKLLDAIGPREEKVESFLTGIDEGSPYTLTPHPEAEWLTAYLSDDTVVVPNIGNVNGMHKRVKA